MSMFLRAFAVSAIILLASFLLAVLIGKFISFGNPTDED